MQLFVINEVHNHMRILSLFLGSHRTFFSTVSFFDPSQIDLFHCDPLACFLMDSLSHLKAGELDQGQEFIRVGIAVREGCSEH